MSYVAPTVVVIGNGMASHVFCQSVAQRAAKRHARVVVFGDEPIPAYNRVRLSDVMHGASAESLLLAPHSWYVDHTIELHTGDPVVTIDREARVVRTESGREQSYDKLVFATGSSAWRPPIEGIDHPRCHVYRTLADVNAIDAACAHVKQAVVIGGGLLGLEAAKVLMDRGIAVAVVEAGDALMHRQLDTASAEVLRAQVEALGVVVHTGVAVERIEHGEHEARVCLRGDTELTGQLVIVAAGVRPADALARAADLECNVRGGIVVDERLVTSDANIYAIGECASRRGHTYGLYAPSREMAVVAAENVLGGARVLGKLDLSCHLKLLGIDVVALGDYGREHALAIAEVKGGRRTLLHDQGLLVGAYAVGTWPERLRVERAIAAGRRLSTRDLERFESTGVIWREGERSLSVIDWPDAAVVCNCTRVTAGQIREHARRGAVDVAAICARTQASSVCGSCKPLIGTLMGDAGSTMTRTRTWGVLGISLAALASAVVTFFMTPLAFAASVESAWVQVDRFWRDPWLKQVSGFVVVGLALVGLVVSARKRLSWLQRGSFSAFRAFHSAVGLGTLVVLAVHTGFRLGDNLNFALMVAFLVLSAVGALAGVLSGLEARVELPVASSARRWRRPVGLAHVVTLWPLPILLIWHVVAVYYF